MWNYNNRNIAFLFGSGISLSAGLPTTQKITCKLLYDPNVMEDRSSTYKFIPRNENRENECPNIHNPQDVEHRKQALEVQKFLGIIRSEIERINCRIDPDNIDLNYEDIYYVIEQIYDHKIQNYENPAIQPFIDILLGNYPDILESDQFRGLLGFVREARYYIKWLVRELICRSEEKNHSISYITDFFKPLKELDIKLTGIFTLNHDRLLERCFKETGISYTDGFSPNPSNSKRMWKPELYSGDYLLNLFKLHGGVDWYVNANQWVEKNCILPSSAGAIEMTEVRPNILVGTFNKLLEYQGGIFNELMCMFRERLKQTDSLIVSGYSLRDKGINTAIVEWIYSTDNKVVVLVHEKPDQLIAGARKAIKNAFKLMGDRLHKVEKHITDKEDSATMEDILREIDGVK